MGRGSALWIVVTFVAWLICGRKERPQPVAELPGDTSRRTLIRPLIMFAVIRALAIAGSVALAFGLDLSHGYWLPIATIVAMKPSLEQATLVGVQRIAGGLIAAAAAVLLLLIPASEHGLRLLAITHGLEVVALVLFMHGAATRLWNYAVYCGAIAAAVLILVDLPQPSSYGAEGDRVLWTLCGAGIGVLVMLLAGLLAKRTAKAPPKHRHGKPNALQRLRRRSARLEARRRSVGIRRQSARLSHLTNVSRDPDTAPTHAPTPSRRVSHLTPLDCWRLLRQPRMILSDN